MLKTSIIIPIIEDLGVEENLSMFNKALDSLNNQELLPNEIIVVSNKDNSKYIKKHKNVVFVQNDGDTSFASQVNIGVENCNGDFFSVLEIDDEYSSIAIKEFVNYHDNYDSNCMIYLNLTTIVTPEGKLWQLVNEMPWADSFSDSDRGYITEESLKVYYDYVVSGAFIDVNKFKSIGGLKKSMKHFGNLEFLLRASNSSENPIIFVVPKLSYSHTTMREGSVSYNEYNTITKKEAEYWRDKAMEIYTCHEDNATDDNNALESEEA